MDTTLMGRNQCISIDTVFICDPGRAIVLQISQKEDVIDWKLVSMPWMTVPKCDAPL